MSPVDKAFAELVDLAKTSSSNLEIVREVMHVQRMVKVQFDKLEKKAVLEREAVAELREQARVTMDEAKAIRNRAKESEAHAKTMVSETCALLGITPGERVS